MTKLLRGRYIWLIVALLGVAALLAYPVEHYILSGLPPDLERHGVHMILLVLRSGLLLIAVGIAAWRFRVKGGLAVCLAIVPILLPHIISEVSDPIGMNVLVLYLYGIGTPTGIALSWVVGKHKRMEEALRASEKWLSATLRSIGDAVIATDAKGYVALMNPVAQTLTGWNEEDATGKPLTDVFNIINEETGKQAENPVARVIREGIIVGLANHTILIAKDGTKRPVDDSGAPIRDDKGNITGVILVFRDITERKQAEETLRESEAKFKGLVTNVKLGIFRSTQGRSGRFLEVNPAMAEITGYSREELLQMNVSDLYVHPEKRGAVLGKVVSVTGKVTNELYLRKKDGAEIVVSDTKVAVKDDKGKVIFFDGIIEDITERKRAEEALRESEAILTEAQGVAHIGNWSWDLRTNELLWSKENYRIFGLSHEVSPSYENFENTIHPEDREFVNKNIEDALKGKKPYYIDFRIILPSGRERIVQAIGKVDYDNKDLPIRLFGTVQDITERKRMEEREKQLQRELSLSSRMAAIGELAAGVAHEINNPLTGIMGFSELLLNKSTDREAIRRLERIHSEAKRAAKIVQNLLTFARRQEPKKEHSDINDILRKTLELRAYELKTSNIKVAVKPAPDLPQIAVDPHQIQEVFLNIILNAEHAMIEANGGGKLSIQTQRIDGFIRVSFADDGPGIPAEHIGKLFDPFFTTRGDKGGTGLGLSICHGIVTEHGGRIYARSKPGRGTTFFVELPV